jgi:diguanylate cyclase (GGDEF)-like protein
VAVMKKTEEQAVWREMRLAAVVSLVVLASLGVHIVNYLAAPVGSFAPGSPQFVALVSVGAMFLTVLYLLFRSVTDMRRSARLAFVDELTGMPNRRKFDQELQELLDARRGTGDSLAVLYFDLDRFKSINDGFGHEAGDMVLREFASRVRMLLREDDMFARLSGDEFAAILREKDGEPDLEAVATRVFAAMRLPVMANDRRIFCGVSIGGCIAGESDRDASRLLNRADFALIQAKESGRNTFRRFDPEMANEIALRASMGSELRQAIANDEFSLRYQPLVGRSDGKTRGVEALLRWRHPEFGQVPPSTFIPLAEEIGLIEELGQFVLRKACQDIGPLEGIKLAVNISPTHFVQPGFAEGVAEILKETGFQADRLELEITEGVFMSDPARTRAAIESLQKLGVRIALDDFGTGYSSMSYLRNIPVDRIKIDRSFLVDAASNEDARTMVSTMIQLGRSLGLNVTVEGVESEQQFRFLRASDCTDLQGYLFSKPVLLEELKAGDPGRYEEAAEPKARSAA